MTRRVLTDAEHIVSIREVIQAAWGDWHEATTLLSVRADISWLLERAEATIDPRETTGRTPNGLTHMTVFERAAAVDRDRAFGEAKALDEAWPLARLQAAYFMAGYDRRGLLNELGWREVVEPSDD